MNTDFLEGLDGHPVASLPFSHFIPSPFNNLSLRPNLTWISAVS